jgi:hypothetical protein
VQKLRAVRTKPVARFVDTFTPAELRDTADFLVAVAAATDKAKHPDKATASTVTAAEAASSAAQ